MRIRRGAKAPSRAKLQTVAGKLKTQMGFGRPTKKRPQLSSLGGGGPRRRIRRQVQGRVPARRATGRPGSSRWPGIPKPQGRVRVQPRRPTRQRPTGKRPKLQGGIRKPASYRRFR